METAALILLGELLPLILLFRTALLIMAGNIIILQHRSNVSSSYVYVGEN